MSMSEIYRAERRDAEDVCRIVRSTILQVYPRHYSQAVVDEFIKSNDPQTILADIDRGCVYYIRCGVSAVGTVTVRSDLISRLYVLPLYQGRGFGEALLEFAESRVAQLYKKAWLEAVPSFESFYLRHGYTFEKQCSCTIGGEEFYWNELSRVLR